MIKHDQTWRGEERAYKWKEMGIKQGIGLESSQCCTEFRRDVGQGEVDLSPGTIPIRLSPPKP